MSSYLLPCDCGKTVVVDVSQAGEQVTCGCGAKLAVPKLSLLKKLPPAAAEQQRKSPGRSAESRRSTWGKDQGILFAIGALVTLAGIALVGLSAIRRIDVPEFNIDEIKAATDKDVNERIDTLGPAELWDAWAEFRKFQLDEQDVPVFVHIQRYREKLTFYLRLGIGVIVVGGLFLAAALFPRRKLA